MLLSMDNKIGACRGEIQTRIPSGLGCMQQCLVAGQYVQNKLGYLTERAVEWLFGCVSNLPAESAMVRWSAVKGSPSDKLFSNFNPIEAKP